MVWVNLDGECHQFVLADAGGAVVTSTEVASATGRPRSVAFEATRDLATYRCRVHPGTMRGIASADGAAGGDRTPGSRTDDATARNETARNETTKRPLR